MGVGSGSCQGRDLWGRDCRPCEGQGWEGL